MKDGLRLYQCHKQVRAAKIGHISRHRDGELVLVFEEGSVLVPKEYAEKHNPHPGGYYVRYQDGYESFSPAEPFEDGYTLVEE